MQLPPSAQADDRQDAIEARLQSLCGRIRAVIFRLRQEEGHLPRLLRSRLVERSSRFVSRQSREQIWHTSQAAAPLPGS